MNMELEMIIEKACWERGCACYDHRVDEGVKVTLAREWVGLTDEEIREFEIWLDGEEEKHGWNPPADIVKYLEAKLREKNA